MSDQQHPGPGAPAPQGPAFLQKRVFPVAQVGITKEIVDGEVRDAFLFVTPDGTAYSFPFMETAKRAIVAALSSGIVVAGANEVPK